VNYFPYIVIVHMKVVMDYDVSKARDPSYIVYSSV